MPNVFSLAATFCETFHSIQLFCHESAVGGGGMKLLFRWNFLSGQLSKV